MVHGPNLNMLGTREPEIYGDTTLADIDILLKVTGDELGVDVESFQSNHEGDIVEKIQEAKDKYDAILINAAAYTHTSVAIHDAIAAVDVTVIEVHISNIHAREPFRHKSLISPVAKGIIMGFGAEGYALALRGAVTMINAEKNV